MSLFAVLTNYAVLLVAFLRSALRLRDSGQGLVEYGLILVLIMVVCVAVVGTLGQTISTVWYNKLVNSGAFN